MLFVAGRCLVPMDETDLFFNVRQGGAVLETGRIAATNATSFTYPDHRDVNLAWVFQVLLALAFKAGGISGCVALKTLFAMGTVAVLFRVALARGAHPAVAAAALALATWAMEHRLVERPHLVTFLGLAVVLLGIERLECGRPRMLWGLVGAAIVWANANSCFFEAPAILVLYAAGALLDAQLGAGGEREARRAVARRAAVVAAALMPFMFLTPSGMHALGYIANHWRMPWLRPLEEYFPIAWPDHAPAVFLAGALVIGAALGLPRTPFRVALPIVALFALGAARRRFLAEYALLAGPAVAASWTAMVGRVRSLRVDPDLARTLGSAAVALGLLALAALPRVQNYRAGRPMFDISMEANLVPAGAVDFMDKVGLRGRMYNDMELGSYLMWEGGGKYKVFQDPRINAYPAEFHAIMKRKDLTRAEWQALMDRFGVQTALISYPGQNPRAALFDFKLWATVQRTDWALAFVRRLPEFAKPIRRFELPLTFSWDEKEGTLVNPVEEQLPDSPLRRCEWARRLGEFYLAQADVRKAWQKYREAVPEGNEDCIDADARQATKIAMGGLALQMSNPAAAVDMYKDMPDPESKSNRGFALSAMKRWEEALEEFDGALRLAPATVEALFGRGVALMELRRRDEAVVALKTFLRRAPDHVAAKDARGRLEAMGAKP